MCTWEAFVAATLSQYLQCTGKCVEGLKSHKRYESQAVVWLTVSHSIAKCLQSFPRREGNFDACGSVEGIWLRVKVWEVRWQAAECGVWILWKGFRLAAKKFICAQRRREDYQRCLYLRVERRCYHHPANCLSISSCGFLLNVALRLGTFKL